jgi:hypothetical protein
MYTGFRSAMLLAPMTFLALGSGTGSGTVVYRDLVPVDAPAVPVAARAPADPVGGAVIGQGFCFFVVGPGFNGYSGSSERVDTPSGRVNYRCKADLLFGEAAPRAMHLRDVTFTDFFLGTLVPCDINISAGGEATVQCHE